MRLSIMFLLALSSCGKRVEAQPPHGIIEELQAEVERIKPLLLSCDGLPTKAINCNDLQVRSDDWGIIGYASLANLGDFSNAANAIREDGRPFRTRENAEASTGDFSRDHVLSVLQFSAGSRTFPSSMFDYAKRNNWSVCDKPKCQLTPGLLDLANSVAGYVGVGKVSSTPRELAEAQILIDAEGDRCDLVSDYVFLKAYVNKLTSNYVKAAKRCEARTGTLYTRYVRALVTDGNYPTTDLLAIMREWHGPGTGGHFTAQSNGWSLVAMATWIQKGINHEAQFMPSFSLVVPGSVQRY